MDLASITPLILRDRVRVMVPIAGVEAVARELAALTEKFDAIGLSSPANSILVTTEMSKHWTFKSPPGWDAEHVVMWRTLPTEVARYITERRELDLKAVRACQNLNAEMNRQRRKGRSNAEQKAPAATGAC